ncbi:aminotransferase class III-fold pyridoxal phosphate-dependent enzyme [Halopseudomonas pachastrellae]|nr:aminotransferase class III-fold pyridoxal phosphate-dependent enzyme [Halopseudomonas pachastrellae]
MSPFPHAYRYGWSEEQATEFALRELDHILKTRTAPSDTAAMLIEPVQGEFGYYPANTAFMQGLAERCRQHGILLICDEIQAGYGRTGASGATIILTLRRISVITAKGLASGFPLSAIAASESLMSKGLAGSQGGTYGANAVACAAALATLEVIDKEQLVDNAAQQGGLLGKRLHELQQRFPLIDTVRGKGLMLGMEIADDYRHPRGEQAAAIVAAAEAEGLLLLRCGTEGQIVRWLPPLTVSSAEVDEAVARFARAVQKVAA